MISRRVALDGVGFGHKTMAVRGLGLVKAIIAAIHTTPLFRTLFVAFSNRLMQVKEDL